jgi:hypothetical protein
MDLWDQLPRNERRVHFGNCRTFVLIEDEEVKQYRRNWTFVDKIRFAAKIAKIATLFSIPVKKPPNGS